MLSLPWDLGGCANRPGELPRIAQGRLETALNGVRRLEHPGGLAGPYAARPARRPVEPSKDNLASVHVPIAPRQP